MKSFLSFLSMFIIFTSLVHSNSGFDLENMECEEVKAGSVAFTTGQTSITIFIDGLANELSFTTTTDTESDAYTFTYVVTDADGKILGIPPGNTVDFELASFGVCKVYGLSYTGTLNIVVGDNLFEVADISTECSELSSNNLTVTRIAPEVPMASFFVSSNTSSEIGIYEVLDNNDVVASSFMSVAEDADGIYYDEANDVLYQLNRTDNVINAYKDVLATLALGMIPQVSATSSSDFTNGREIAFSNGKIIVADDVTDANKFVIYNASPTAITLDKVVMTDINLWGIFISGNTLYAIEDNSSNVAIYNDFFNKSGMLSPDAIISVEGLVRTHGLVYVEELDMMLLTDVGDPDSDNDGAVIRIKKFTKASKDGMVTLTEQIRVEGGSSRLGNPVDIAYDKVGNRIYVAERKRNGGMVLCFKLPSQTGGIAPEYAQIFPGASAIHLPGIEVDACEGINGGLVSLASGGTETTIIVDGVADFISFHSSVIPKGYSFTYVVTDSDGMILGIPPGNTVDFDPAGLGTCIVYGVSYVGALNISIGDDFLADGLQISDICFDVSDNSLSIKRIEPQPSEIQFYVSSNTTGLVSVFGILDNNEIVMSSFESMAMDADGIYYDELEDVLYQLNRTENVINAYSNVRSALAAGNTPMVTATSTSDFTNGREMAFYNGKLVVAEDGDENKFVIYNASATEIKLDKIYNAGINLWGIHLNGNTLFAIEDNSSNVATYENFFDNAAGDITATSSTSVEGLVRTHGLTYIAELDMMFLTDIGDAESDNDGAIVRIKKFTSAIADGVVSAAEQIRVEGGSSKLGNPVDIAYDRSSKRVYVAERKRNGGMVLGFKLPSQTGGIAPEYSKLVAGASAIHFPGTGESPCLSIEAGTVSLATGGTETTIIIDGIADLISFNSSGASMNSKFTYVVTDSDGKILGIPPANTVDFDPAGEGVCIVYGVSYLGSLNIEIGDDFLADGLEISTICSSVSSNSLTINRISAGTSDLRFYSSSNTTGQIGVFSILDDNDIAMASFASANEDADGIFYDEKNDVLYQLNRTTNKIDLYDAVQESMDNGIVPTVLTSSMTDDFTNGREIAVVDNMLIVAQDGNDSNGGNKLVVYDITPTSITFNREYTVDIDLWGIFATGNTLFAIEDNSSNVAVYADFFNMPAGAISPTNLVLVEGMVRTHGLTYDFYEDMLIMTDIGDAASNENDGAIVVIRNFTEVASDGVVTADEQARAFGGSSQLANPVDITLDKAGKMVYVAERKNSGGMIMGFKLPKLTGGIAPEYMKAVPGASAVHLPGVEVGICDIANGGVVALATGGIETTIFVDGEEDNISFTTTVPDETFGFTFTYVVTDSEGMILGIPEGNTVEFNGAGLGTCYVYGLSYIGDLNIEIGMDLFADGLEISTDCSDLSDNKLTVNRVEPEVGVAYLFASSNTENETAAFRILESGNVIPGFFITEDKDADGLSYDESLNILYQVNRSANSIDAFDGVDAFFSVGATPGKSTSSETTDFSNGREITWMGAKLVLAQDENDTNGGNKFYVYDASASSINLDKVINADINLWGINAAGTTLYAVEDNSNNIAIYENFLANEAGDVSPTSKVSVESLVRTHGLAYIEHMDMMLCTDIGDANSGTDGAIILIYDWSIAITNDTIEDSEQIRIEGDSTLLGNPVDIAYDETSSRLYVAERKNNGGRILGFDLLDVNSGEYKPAFIYNFAGASSVVVSAPLGPLNELAVAKRTVTNNLKLYPSPASISINLALEVEVRKLTLVQIFDMSGKLVMSENITLEKGENTINMNVRNLGSGFHVVSIPALNFSEKFLKIK